MDDGGRKKLSEVDVNPQAHVGVTHLTVESENNEDDGIQIEPPTNIHNQPTAQESHILEESEHTETIVNSVIVKVTKGCENTTKEGNQGNHDQGSMHADATEPPGAC